MAACGRLLSRRVKIAVSPEMGDYYAKVFERYDFRERMRKFFETYDLLLSPTLPLAAFSAGTNVPPTLSDRTIVS